jgi:hypothetical protein
MKKTMETEIRIAYDIYGREFKYLVMGRVSGKSFFKRFGFVECENPDYVKRENEYFHYNSIKKCWLSESHVITSDNRALVA